MPNANGVRKPVFYFLKPSYWTGNGGGKVEGMFSLSKINLNSVIYSRSVIFVEYLNFYPQKEAFVVA